MAPEKEKCFAVTECTPWVVKGQKVTGLMDYSLCTKASDLTEVANWVC